MKKNIMFWVVFFVLSGIILPGVIEVQIPDSSTTWLIGTEYKIVWSSSCSASGYKIEIYKDSISISNRKLKFITYDNSTSKDWKIGDNFTPGRYIIRVRNAQNNCIGVSKLFWIKNKVHVAAAPPAAFIKIKIISPDWKTSWKEGTSSIIKWKDSNPVKKTIKIRLYNNKNQHIYEIRTILASNIKKINAGRTRVSEISKINWYIPKNTFPLPGKFKIKIISVNGTVMGESDKFYIVRETDKWDFGDGVSIK